MHEGVFAVVSDGVCVIRLIDSSGFAVETWRIPMPLMTDDVIGMAQLRLKALNHVPRPNPSILEVYRPKLSEWTSLKPTSLKPTTKRDIAAFLGIGGLISGSLVYLLIKLLVAFSS